MPNYIYECNSCGIRREKFFRSSDDRTETVKCLKCGRRAEWHFGATIATTVHSGNHWKTNGGFENNRGEMGSLSRAVHADQVTEQLAADVKNGVDHLVNWVPDNRGLVRPKFGSSRARNKWDKANKFFDRS